MDPVRIKKDRKENVALVVDDDMFMRSLVVKGLGEMCRVVEVSSGDEALQAYKDCVPNVVFLDIHMPGKNGQELIEEILEIDPYAHIVMLSADSAEQNVVEATSHGAKAFITKPFTKEVLIKYFVLCPTVKYSDHAA